MISELLPELPLVLPPIGHAMCRGESGHWISFNPSSTIYLLYTFGQVTENI